MSDVAIPLLAILFLASVLVVIYRSKTKRDEVRAGRPSTHSHSSASSRREPEYQTKSPVGPQQVKAGCVVAFGGARGDVPPGLTDVVEVAVGLSASLALTSDGTVVGWGAFHTSGSPWTVNPPAKLTGVQGIAVGWDHCLALIDNETVYGWGGTYRSSWDVPHDLSGVVAIAAGRQRSLALRADGRVVAFGDQTAVPDDLTDVIAIAAGLDHNLALRRNGTVAAWGSDKNGQSTVPSGLTDVVAVAAGWNHSLALRRNGTVVSWGGNKNQWGQPREPQLDVPAGLSGVTRISAGNDFSLAVKQDGAVVVWGFEGSQPEIPHGLTDVTAIAAGSGRGLAVTTLIGTASASADQIIEVASGGAHCLALKSDGTVSAWGTNNYGQAEVPDGLAGVSAIAAGYAHSLALKNDGTVVAWGSDLNGQTAVPLELAGVRSITAGGQDSGALLGDGTAVFWGALGSAVGRVRPTHRGPFTIDRITDIGVGDTHLAYVDGFRVSGVSVPLAESYDPVEMPFNLTEIRSISVGSGHCLGLTYEERVVAWGRNDYGQADVPVDLWGVQMISAGASCSLALLRNGTVVSWGYPFTADDEVPMPAGLTDVTFVAAGSQCLALKSDGTVVTWGTRRDSA